MTSTPTSPTLLSEDLLRVIELAQQSDSIELKLTLPAGAYRSAAKALAIDPLEAQIRQVYFFDTPELALNRVGVVARARRIQGRAAIRRSSCGPSSPRRSSGRFVPRPTSPSRSTRCPAGTSAPGR